MAEQSLGKLLAQARKAYQQKDKQKGARLVDQILQQDFTYPGIWELLHQLYGAGQPFGDFQRSFATRFYPDKLHLIESSRPQAVAPPEKKPSFFQRLLRGFKKSKTEQVAAEKGQQNEPIRAAAPIPPSREDSRLAQAGQAISPSSQMIPVPAAVPSKVIPQAQTATSSKVVPQVSAAEETGFPPSQGQLTVEDRANLGLVKAAGQKIRVVLVDDIAQTRETIVRTLRFQEGIEVVGTASNGRQAIQLVHELRPDVVLMDVNMPDMDGIAATARIKRDLPNTEVVILTVQDDLDYLRRSMLAGARDFLSKPPMIDELIEAIQRAGAYSIERRTRQPDFLLPISHPSNSSQGKIITVYSPRGGSGCTMVAVNLALGLQSEETPVVVVDADLQFGDVSVLFNTQSKLSILDLAPRADELDPDIVNEVLKQHPSGVKILHPPRPERSELVTGPQLNQLCHYLGTLFSYVVVDTSHRINETNLAALDASDMVLLVSTLDIPSISRARIFLEMIPMLNLKQEKVSLVVNQFDPRVGITLERLPQVFGKEPAAIIPLSILPVSQSVNNGVPILARRESAQQPVGQGLLQVVRHAKKRLGEIQNPAD